jgi:hypothetical protein
VTPPIIPSAIDNTVVPVPTIMSTVEPVPETMPTVEPVPETIPTVEPVPETIPTVEPVPATMPTVEPVPATIDVEDTLRVLGITMDVKITQIPNNIVGKAFGPPSVEMTMMDYNILSNVSDVFITEELKLSEELKNKMVENPITISFAVTNKLNEIVEELKTPKNQNIKDNTDKIINYLNNKKKISDIRNEITKFSVNVMNTPNESQNILTILEKYQTAISTLNQMNPEVKALNAIATNNSNQIQLSEAKAFTKSLDNYLDKMIFNIILGLFDNVKSYHNIKMVEIIEELKKKQQTVENVNDVIKIHMKNVAGGSKNIQQTLKKIQQLMNNKLGGNNLVLNQLKEIRNT